VAGVFPDYVTRYCVEWEDPRFGWVVAQTFLESRPDELVPHSVSLNGEDRILVPQLVPCKVEVSGTVIDGAINFNMHAVVYVDPEPLTKILTGFSWRAIATISDGYWDDQKKQGALYPVEFDLYRYNTQYTKGRLLAELQQKSRGGIIVKTTHGQYEAYFVGEDIRNIVGRVHVYKIMEC
jgi:hypothetical protein